MTQFSNKYPLSSIFLLIVLFCIAISVASASDVYPSNVTDLYRGNWNLLEQTDPSSHLVFTQSKGSTTMRLQALPSASSEFQFIQGDLYVKDGQYSSDWDWHLVVKGVYSPSSGSIYIVAMPWRYDITSYLQYDQAINETGVDLAYQSAVEQSLRLELSLSSSSSSTDGSTSTSDGTMQSVQNLSGPLSSLNLDSLYSSTYDPRMTLDGQTIPSEYSDHFTRCIFTSRLQLTPNIPGRDYSASPSDSSLYVPDLDDQSDESTQQNLSGLLNSPSCNISLSVQIDSFLFDQYFSKAVNYCVMVCAVAALQLFFLIRQTEYSGTQSAAARVSLLTIGGQAILDAYLCLMHLTTGILLGNVFNAFAMAAFLKFILFSVFEMRYLLAIWKARRPQSFAALSDLRRELGTLYSRFYGFLFIGIILLYQINGFLMYYVFFLYSFWVPQIVSNFQRDARKSVSPEYIIGTSFSRLLIPFYFFACPENFLTIKSNTTFCAILASWVGIQVFVLLLQHFFGSRFFLPRLFQPPKYDYHRPLPRSVQSNLHSVHQSSVPDSDSSSSVSPSSPPPSDSISPAFAPASAPVSNQSSSAAALSLIRINQHADLNDGDDSWRQEDVQHGGISSPSRRNNANNNNNNEEGNRRSGLSRFLQFARNRASADERASLLSGSQDDDQDHVHPGASGSEIPMMDIERGISSGSAASVIPPQQALPSASAASPSGMPVISCVICMMEVEIVPGGYMITPCDHVYHVECLQRWMEIKLECPTCRRALPDL